MYREHMRFIVALPTILVHAACFFLLMWFKTDWGSPEQRQDVAFVLLPVSAAYFLAIVRSAIDEAGRIGPGPKVNHFYATIVILVTFLTLAALLLIVIQVPSPMIPTMDHARRAMVVFEIAFGAAFGLIATDLFGKVQKIELPE